MDTKSVLIALIILCQTFIVSSQCALTNQIYNTSATPIATSEFQVAHLDGASKFVEVAEDFTPTTNVDINEICIIGFWDDPNCASDIASPRLRITIYADLAGQPDHNNILHGPLALNATEATTGRSWFASDERSVTGTFTPYSALAGTPIWIGVMAEISPSCPSFTWVATTTEMGGNAANRTNSTGSFSLRADGPGDDLAFSIGGTPSSLSSSTIPTLGEWGLIILSIGLLIFGLVVIKEKKSPVFSKIE